jgi:hypothetical protein
MGPMTIRAVSRSFISQQGSGLSVIVFEIGSLLHRMADPAHLGHPHAQFNTGLTGDDIVCHVTVTTGGRVFFPLNQRLGMGPPEITLVFLGVTLFTFFVIEKK